MSLRLSLSLALVGILASRAHASSPRTFDVVSFAPPDGWSVDDTSKDHIALADQGPGRVGQIIIYAGAPASGDLMADFKTQWKSAVEPMLTPDATPEPTRGTLPGNVAILSGGSTAKQGDKDLYARLFVIDGGGKVVTVLVVTNGADIYDRYEDVVNTMLGATKVTASPFAPPKPAKPAKPGAAAPPPPPAPKPVPLAEDPPLADTTAPALDKKKLSIEWHHDTTTPPDKASAMYGDVYELTAKGKFDYRFIGKAGAEVVRETDAGGYAYKDGRLLLLFNKRPTTVFRITSYTDDKDGTTMNLLPDGFPLTAGNAALFGQTWTHTKMKKKSK